MITLQLKRILDAAVGSKTKVIGWRWFGVLLATKTKTSATTK
jgi:hypothetical protein